LNEQNGRAGRRVRCTVTWWSRAGSARDTNPVRLPPPTPAWWADGGKNDEWPERLPRRRRDLVPKEWL